MLVVIVIIVIIIAIILPHKVMPQDWVVLLILKNVLSWPAEEIIGKQVKSDSLSWQDQQLLFILKFQAKNSVPHVRALSDWLLI